MKKSWAMKWVKALRSGKYKQGKKNLRTVDNKYCCLGVLCEVAGVPARLSREADRYEYGGFVAGIPSELAEKLDMRSGQLGYLRDNKLIQVEGNPLRYASLAAVNDETDATFDDIADFIEKHWRLL